MFRLGEATLLIKRTFQYHALFQNSLLIAFAVYFLHVCTWEGMVLFAIRQLFERLPLFIKKPLFDCPTCMCMWWGGLAFYLLNIHQFNFINCIISCMAAAGIVTVISFLVEGLKDGLIVFNHKVETDNDEFESTVIQGFNQRNIESCQDQK